MICFSGHPRKVINISGPKDFAELQPFDRTVQKSKLEK